MRISFDFDSTLDKEILQSLCLKLSYKDEIFIITSRMDNNKAGSDRWNDDLYEISKQLNIERENIYFTNGDDKWKIVKDLEIDMHFDDDDVECDLINENTNCIAIKHQFWKEKYN